MAAGDRFSLADCGAAPFLFYADWTHPIGEAFPNVRAYRERLLARPSFTRAVDEARPFRPLFPLGAPDHDERAAQHLDGDGREEVVGYKSNGARVALSTGTNFGEVMVWLPEMCSTEAGGNAQGAETAGSSTP